VTWSDAYERRCAFVLVGARAIEIEQRRPGAHAIADACANAYAGKGAGRDS
jgi:hypothetical protein